MHIYIIVLFYRFTETFNAVLYSAKKVNDNQLMMALINFIQGQLFQLKAWNTNASKLISFHFSHFN